MNTNGRTTIYANIKEEKLLSLNEEDRIKVITNILQNSISIHNQNKSESKYLLDYLYGIQDVRNKEKKTRTDINNKSVENWAWAFMDVKKSMLVGKPIIYAPYDNISNNEITQLNKFIKEADKDIKDQETYEDLFACGRSYVYCWTNNESGEPPFKMLNLDVLNTEVVYSSSIEKEQLLEYVVTPQMYTIEKKDNNSNELITENVMYNDYTVYLKDYIYTFNDKTGNIQYEEDSAKPNIYKKHLIYEYYLNKYRISALEIGKDIFNDINDIESMDKDDIESFVNAIMVFTNAKVDKEKMDAIKEYGAISIKSTNDKKASVELLQNRLKSADTQTYYLRKLIALHEILGVPQSQSNEQMNAETGKAMMIGQGFTSSNLRAENEEKAFKRGDRKVLELILTICRENSNSGIKDLQSQDVDIKFSRDLSDSILTKTQALMNLSTVKIPPAVANAVVNLFSDPVAVTKMQEEYVNQLDEKERMKEEEQAKKEAIEDNKIDLKKQGIDEAIINE